MTELNDLTYLIIGCVYKVHSELGPGLLESTYEICLEHELRKAGLKVQLWTPYFRDELKSIVAMDPDFIHTDNIHAKQALNISQ